MYLKRGGLNRTIWHLRGFFSKSKFSLGWFWLLEQSLIQAIISEDLWHGVAMLITVFLVKPFANPFYMIPEPGQREPFSSNHDQPCKIDWHKSCSLWYPPGPQTVIMLLPSEQCVLHFLFLKPRFKLGCTQIWGPIVSCQLRWHSGSPIDPSPHYCQQGKATKIVMRCLIQI